MRCRAPDSARLIPEVTCVDASDWFWPPWAALLLSHVGPPHSLVAPYPRRQPGVRHVNTSDFWD